MKRIIRYRRTLLLLMVLVILVASPAMARAGGKGKGGAAVGGIALILYGIYYAVWRLTVSIRNWDANTLLREIDRYAPKWNLPEIEKRVERTYYAVQNAWTKGNMESAAEFLSPCEQARLQEILDDHAKHREKNVLEEINLESSEVVGIRDENGDSQDEIQVLIKGSMVDYQLSLTSHDFILEEGQTKDQALANRSFWEIWTFSWRKGAWVLSGISTEVGITDIVTLSCFSNDKECELVSLPERSRKGR